MSAARKYYLVDDRVIRRAERRQELDSNPLINELMTAESIIAEKPDVHLTQTQKRLKLAAAVQSLANIQSKYQRYIKEKTGGMTQALTVKPAERLAKTAAKPLVEAATQAEQQVPAEVAAADEEERRVIEEEKIPNEDNGDWVDEDEEPEEDAAETTIDGDVTFHDAAEGDDALVGQNVTPRKEPPTAPARKQMERTRKVEETEEPAASSSKKIFQKFSPRKLRENVPKPDRYGFPEPPIKNPPKKKKKVPIKKKTVTKQK